MAFENAKFIKPDMSNTGNYAPMFRKKFQLTKKGKATLYVCGLGYGYYYINGKKVSEDIFTAPVSDYTKTLWYNKYDVSELLSEGENIFCACLGNGFYNETIKTVWDFDKAPWRDIPKLTALLEIDGEAVLKTDNTWLYTIDTPIIYNNLRSGEYFDARKYNEGWKSINFDDSSWKNAVEDNNMPQNIFRECLCEPIREFEEYKPVNIFKASENKYVFDIGQNISGYVRLKAMCPSGTELTIRYAEQINDDYSRQMNNMKRAYPESEIQTDKFICGDKPIVWSPKFTYHGFRFIEIEGITSPNEVEVSGVFVHQAVETRSHFECSNEFLNKMFNAGIYSVYANMFYQLTDCPTREKQGWTNDAQSSAEQILTNFKAEKFFEKWLQDIFDAMKDSGELPGIIPTGGWGFDWGNGPVSDGVLFEIPYRLYLHSGNTEPLFKAMPYFKRYFDFIKTRTDADGFIRFGLNDWARPDAFDEVDVVVPVELINAMFMIKFNNIARLAAELTGNDTKEYEDNIEKQKELVISTYINTDGTCKVHKQTAVALLIYFDTYTNFDALKNQLKTLIEEKDFHHDCGMVGLRILYGALNKCGLQEYAYSIINSKGYPSYNDWFERDATTLWEFWQWYLHEDSKNHHMYSDFMSWMMKTIAGINKNAPGFKEAIIKPYFFNDLTYAKAHVDTVSGKLGVKWQKNGETIELEIDVPENMEVMYDGNILNAGKNIFNIKR